MGVFGILRATFLSCFCFVGVFIPALALRAFVWLFYNEEDSCFNFVWIAGVLRLS